MRFILTTSAVRQRIVEGKMRYWLLLVAAVSIVTFVEISTDEDTVTMLTIFVVAAALGCWSPRQFWLSGLLVGLVVSSVAVFSQATGWHPQYETAAQAAGHGPLYAASLAVLVVPALLASGFGAWLRNMVADSEPARPRHP